jgi:tRNA-Thr(GGU) m(6)t(6)A37 methyltransferase TsaA
VAGDQIIEAHQPIEHAPVRENETHIKEVLYKLRDINISKRKTFEIFPIGFIRRDLDATYIEILKEYRAGLKELEYFSHAQILWWFGDTDDELQRKTLQFNPPFDAPKLGVFASRAPFRPNPIALTNIRVEHIDNDEGLIETPDIDAFEGSAVLDIKAYLPFYCRIATTKVPMWASAWPDKMPYDGIGLDQMPKPSEYQDSHYVQQTGHSEFAEYPEK